MIVQVPVTVALIVSILVPMEHTMILDPVLTAHKDISKCNCRQYWCCTMSNHVKRISQ